MRISCPYCGERDFSEFRFRREVSNREDVFSETADDGIEAIHYRQNLAGRQSELWHHAYGCRAWLLVERDTLANTIFGVMPVRNKP